MRWVYNPLFFEVLVTLRGPDKFQTGIFCLSDSSHNLFLASRDESECSSGERELEDSESSENTLALCTCSDPCFSLMGNVWTETSAHFWHVFGKGCETNCHSPFWQN